MTRRQIIWLEIKKFKIIYMMILPAVAYYVVFSYLPLVGLTIAFQDFVPGNGFFDGPWVGLENFNKYFSSYYFWRLIKNTFMLSFWSLVWGFPMPIIFALLLNEIRVEWYKRSIQTLSYLPHFVPMVVVCGIIIDATGSDGLVNTFRSMLGAGSPLMFLQEPQFFRSIYVASGIWQEIGWSSIIYLAALTSIDPTLYEAAEVDGAGRIRKMVHITLPCLMPTITVLFILAIGGMMGSDFEKILLLSKPLTYDTSDVISTFVYRKGLQEGDFGFAMAVNIFNMLINLSLVAFANYTAKKSSQGETSLW